MVQDELALDSVAVDPDIVTEREPSPSGDLWNPLGVLRVAGEVLSVALYPAADPCGCILARHDEIVRVQIIVDV